MTSKVHPDAQGRMLGVVTTILGAAKDKLACAYVSLATRTPVDTLAVPHLFEGLAAHPLHDASVMPKGGST